MLKMLRRSDSRVRVVWEIRVLPEVPSCDFPKVSAQLIVSAPGPSPERLVRSELQVRPSALSGGWRAEQPTFEEVRELV